MDWHVQCSVVGWLEFNVPFQHKYGYIRDEQCNVTEELKAGGKDDVCKWWLVSTSAYLRIRNVGLQEIRNIRRRHHWSDASRFLARLTEHLQ